MPGSYFHYKKSFPARKIARQYKLPNPQPQPVTAKPTAIDSYSI